MLRSVDPDHSKGHPASVRDMLDRAARSIDQDAMAGHPLVESQIRMTLWAAYDSLGHFPEAEAQARRAFEVRRLVVGPEHAETLRAMAAVGSATQTRGDYEAAEVMLRQALALQEKTLGPTHADLIETPSKLGHTLRARRDWARAEEVFRRAVDVSRAATPDSDAVARALTNLGVAMMDRGDYDGAEPLLREALQRDRKAHGDKFRNVPRTLGNLAEVLEARGDLTGAESNWHEALDIQRAMLPADHQDTASTLRLLGKANYAAGELVAAEAYLQDGLAMERRLFRPGHPVLVDFLIDLGAVLWDRGKRAEAAAVRREAMDILVQRATAALAARPDSGSRRAAIGRYRLRRGEFDAALHILEEAERIQPTDSRWAALVACVTHFKGDEPRYRAACRRILLHHGDTADPEVAARVAAVCLLAQPAAQDLPRIVGLSERAVPDKGYHGFAEFSQGLAHLRAGWHGQAVERFVAACERATDPALRAASRFYLAVTHCRDSNIAAADTALAAARRELANVPTVDDGDLGPAVEHWLICQAARREAEAPPAVGETRPATAPSPTFQ
jgi:tetratricopeptide (TPR) repeat protein